MNHATSGIDSRVPSVLLTAGRTLLRDPRQILAFLVAAALLTASVFSVSLYRGQLLAAASQVVPQLFDEQLVTSPRAPFLLPAVAVLVLFASVWFVAALVLCVQLADTAFDGRSISSRTAVPRSLRLLPRASAVLILVAAPVGVGPSLLVAPGSTAAGLLLLVPGLYLLVRAFVALPALVLDGHPPVAAVRESWRRTRDVEPLVAATLLVLAVIGLLLSLIPVGGYFLAVSLVVPATLATSVLLYRTGADDRERSRRPASLA